MFCSKCGREIGDDQLYCPFCGNKTHSGDLKKKKLIKSKEGMQRRNKGTNNKKYIICMSLFVFLLVIGMLIAFFLINQEKEVVKEEETISSLELLGDKKNDEEKIEDTVEATTEDIIEATTENITEEITTENVTSYLYSDSPSEAFESYVYTLVNAINTGDYSYAETTMLAGSEIYNVQKDLVDRLCEKGVKEQVDSVSVKYIDTISDTQVWVISDEYITVRYSDGTSKQVHQSYRYLCQLTVDGWLLTDMKDV